MAKDSITEISDLKREDVMFSLINIKMDEYLNQQQKEFLNDRMDEMIDKYNEENKQDNSQDTNEKFMLELEKLSNNLDKFDEIIKQFDSNKNIQEI